MEQEVRIDKFLWAVRIFKTRSQAAEACKKGRVQINDSDVKPSRIVQTKDILQVRKPPVIYSFKVLNLADKRMGAKLVPDFIEDLTPEEELDKLRVNAKGNFIFRAKGKGRPTKKDRRDIQKYRNDFKN